MTPHPTHLHRLGRLLPVYPVVVLPGARKVGETTLAKPLVRRRNGTTHFIDLESPFDIAPLADATLALELLRGLVVLDEIQGRPDISRGVGNCRPQGEPRSIPDALHRLS